MVVRLKVGEGCCNWTFFPASGNRVKVYDVVMVERSVTVGQVPHVISPTCPLFLDTKCAIKVDHLKDFPLLPCLHCLTIILQLPKDVFRVHS